MQSMGGHLRLECSEAAARKSGKCQYLCRAKWSRLCKHGGR